MSTVPQVPTRPDSDAPFPGVADPFRYGWRDVCVTTADGLEEWDRIPLTLEDVLHPQLGDHHVLSDPHNIDCTYLQVVLKARLAGDASAVVLADCGVYWDEPALRHHSPDIAVILGVRQRRAWTTFDVAEEGVRPVLIVEVTSPDTRVNDVVTKVRQYALAGVYRYIIVDARERAGTRRLSLTSYRLSPDGYESDPLDGSGRAWLEPAGIWMGVAVDPVTGADRLACYDPATGEEIGDYTRISQDLAEAQARLESEAARADAETARADAETARADAETARADAEAEARVESENRVRRLEEELRRLRGDASGE